MIQKQSINKAVLRDCVPVGIQKQSAKVELAYSKLMDVNNNIEPLDYGAGVYEDMPDIKRGDAMMLQSQKARQQTQPTEAEEALQGLRADMEYLAEQRARLQGDTDPFAKIQKLKEIMEEKERLQAQSEQEKMEHEKRQLASNDFRKWEDQLKTEQQKLDQALKMDERQAKNELLSVATSKVKKQRGEQDQKKLNASKGTFDVNQMPRSDFAMMKVYQAEKSKAENVKRQVQRIFNTR